MTNNTDTPRSNRRATWHKPDFERLEAHEAEAGAGLGTDGGVFS